MVRKIFLLAILACALFYTWTAYVDLPFLSSTGRLGPGFFPRILGTMMIAVLLYTLVFDAGRQEHGETIADKADPETGTHWRAAAIAAGYTFALIALFNILGGITSLVLFLVASLWTFNPRGHVTNLAVTICVPLAIYFMFDVWLNASMPRSIFPFLV